MAVLYQDNQNELYLTSEVNTMLLEQFSQFLLLRKGESAFYASSGINWYGIEQGLSEIGYELSLAINIYSKYFRETDYEYDIINNVLQIKITVFFLDGTSQELKIRHGVNHGRY